MIGDMIAKVRKEQRMTKTELAKLTDINIGHLTHIEKGERNPSHKALKNICNALKIPYQQLMFTYDKQLNEDNVKYGHIDHIAYNKVPVVKLKDFIDCPASIPSAAMAVEIADDAMIPALKPKDYIFVELNSLLENKEIGVFSLNNKIFVRRFIQKKDKIVLKADNKEIKDIEVSSRDTFYIIGKVLIK